MDDIARLRRRLVDVLALDPHEYANALTADEAATLIRANQLECIVCMRIPFPDGKGYTFAGAYRVLYQQELDGKPLKRKQA